jgi:putative ABC transport system permease protein
VRRQRVARPTRLRLADAIGEATAAIVVKPARAVLTSLGTLLGVAWFVTALGLASTAGGQVSTSFANRLATQVTVRQARPGPAPAAYPYPADVEQRIDALKGVVAGSIGGSGWQARSWSPPRPHRRARGPAAPA